jgi:Rrf2 family protein
LVIDYAGPGDTSADEGEPHMRLQLTKRTDYAIRACLHLAMAERCPIPAHRIAEQMEIPDRFLAQVMGDLTRAGIVGGVSGKNGGYCLRRDAATVSLLELVETVEGPTPRDRCVTRETPCDGDPACALHPVWAEAQAAFTDVLAGASIAELAARQRAATDGIGHLRPERTQR